MYLLGIDAGTSSIKVAVVDVQTQKSLATVQYPEEETEIKSIHISPQTEWWHPFLLLLSLLKNAVTFQVQDLNHKIYILAVLSALLCYGGKTGVCCTVQDVYRLQDNNY